MKNIYLKRKLIWTLSKKDFSSKFTGSFLGGIWAFVQPTITILIYWFVFQVGFKSAPIDDFPYILWLVTGIVPWFYFSDSWMSSTNSIIESSYLVKKVVFNVELLPVVKIISALFVNLFFIGAILVIYALYGYDFSLYNFQVIYYLFASIILVYGLSMITSAVIIFVKDVSPIIMMLTQFGFWLTPIFWQLKMIPEQYSNLLVLNPMYYIVNGYRQSFMEHKWFWENTSLTIYFWAVTCIILLIGVFIFKRLRPHFSDML